MKFWRVLWVSLLIPAAAWSLPLGWEDGNAGDAYVSEFVLTARDVVQRLDLLVQEGKPVYDTRALRTAIAATEVVSEDHVFLNGFERDAVNYYPKQNLIKVNRSRWSFLRRSTETKNRLRLVLHEYLWISGVNDTNFTTSERLIELLNVGNYSPNVWWNPVNPINYVTPSLMVSPDGCGFQPAKLDVRNSDETRELETNGNCGESYRRLRIVKTAGVTPASSNVRGLFHSYELTVFDGSQRKLGEMVFEPEWGQCLLPENGSCRGSGKLVIGGVAIVFWFLRD